MEDFKNKHWKAYRRWQFEKDLSETVRKYNHLVKKKDFFKTNGFNINYDILSFESYDCFKNHINKYYLYYYSLLKEEVNYNLDYTIHQDDDNIFMVEIKNLETMIFFGHNRGWCVSDIEQFTIEKITKRFERYLKIGKTYFIFNKKVKSGNQKSLLLLLKRNSESGDLKAEFNWKPKNYDCHFRIYLSNLNVDVSKINNDDYYVNSIKYLTKDEYNILNDFFDSTDLSLYVKYDPEGKILKIQDNAIFIDKYNIDNWLKIVNMGLTVRIESNVNVDNSNLEDIFKGIRYINGDLILFNCNLETLNGCPFIITGNIDISNNPKLKNLEGGPKIVYGDYINIGNNLNKEIGYPKRLEGKFVE